MYKKDYITRDVKRQVWSRDAIYPTCIEITQCKTCSNLVLMPEPIREFFNFTYHVKSYYVNGKVKSLSGTAEYGHIVSEKNGGKAIVDNLIIQCKPCNVMQGSKNIDLSISLIEDYEMLDVIYDDLDGIMGENIMFCQAICATGAKCKNRAMFNRELCCVHLK